jgi:hypothetical protein
MKIIEAGEAFWVGATISCSCGARFELEAGDTVTIGSRGEWQYRHTVARGVCPVCCSPFTVPEGPRAVPKEVSDGLL